MCGIAGIVHRDAATVDTRRLQGMTRLQAHRGPDGEGYVLLSRDPHEKPLAFDGRLTDPLPAAPPRYGVGLGHRRLAVLDRSLLGHQPMPNERGDLWITYNGEIYNYLELRQELHDLGWRFRSRTDTEVVLLGYQQWGLACLDRLNGMFAFAIWDAGERRLLCARDRLGMKPFYYRSTAAGFAFASEIKALLGEDPATRLPNERMIHDFLAYGLQDHSDETFFEGVRQLTPGHWLVVDDDRIEVRRWWTLEASPSPAEVSDTDATREFRDLFEDAVRLHLRSELEVGSCLSGGLDSSSIVCTLHRLIEKHHGPSTGGRTAPGLQTFTSCFEDPAYDERRYVRSVVAHTGAHNVEVFPEPRTLFDELPRILWFQDEPLGGTSYLAQWEVMRSASEHGIRVVLDGQGGDEVLCGYPGYWGSHLGDLLRSGRLLGFAREAWAYGRRQARIHPTVYANVARALLPAGWVSGMRTRLKRHALWMHPEFARRHAERSRLVGYEDRTSTALGNHVAAYLSTHSLPALLHHEDRNAMAFSIEARLPFLDARLVEFLLRVPARLKLNGGRSKALLRDATADLLPEPVRSRTDKMGFVTPQDRWLRESWRPELNELFATTTFAQRGYWDADGLRRAYRGYCDGRHPIGASLWRCVCLELWLQRFFN